MANKEGKPDYEMATPAELLMSFRNGHLNEYLSAKITLTFLQAMKPDDVFQDKAVQIQPGQVMRQKTLVKEALPIYQKKVDSNLLDLQVIDAMLTDYGVDLKPFKLKEQK